MATRQTAARWTWLAGRVADRLAKIARREGTVCMSACTPPRRCGPPFGLLLVSGLGVMLVAGAAIGSATLTVPAAFPTIQAALNAAASGDTVLVANGVYSGPGNVNLDFNGKAITLRSAGGRDACVIDCQSAGN